MMAPRLVPHLQDDPDDWGPWYDNAPRLRLSSSARLSALRRSFYDEGIAAQAAQGRRVKVATYVLAGIGTDVDAMHQALGVYAGRMGWRVSTQSFTDDPRGCPPEARPAFRAACRYAASGFADGVLALDRFALPPSDEAYESWLRWLHDRMSFIAFAPLAIATPQTSLLLAPSGSGGRDDQEPSTGSSGIATARAMAPGSTTSATPNS
ncbi:hypothetical protein ACWD7T_27740 [Streptomyces sp. 900116325]